MSNEFTPNAAHADELMTNQTDVNIGSPNFPPNMTQARLEASQGVPQAPADDRVLEGPDKPESVRKFDL
jgi:hypothetical protein